MVESAQNHQLNNQKPMSLNIQDGFIYLECDLLTYSELSTFIISLEAKPFQSFQSFAG